ncbi:MAG: hypothetical protein PHU31_06365, partial [Anaerotignum sp.]|nr:hypothetical protein [Anaerotignum sp.]
LSVNSSTLGGLFGKIGEAGTVENLTVSGTITGTYSHTLGAGGIAAENHGTIKNCINQCNITASAYYVGFGGIVGVNWGTVINCANMGNINVSSIDVGVNAGGISGCNCKFIANSYNTGTISFDYNKFDFGNCGGLVSYNVCMDGWNRQFISYCKLL